MSKETALDIINKLHRASQVAEKIYNAGASGQRLLPTPRQAAVLLAIDRATKSGKTTKAVDLTDATGVDRSTMTDIVNRMTGMQWITSDRSQSDRRSYEIKLTPRGVSMLAEATTVSEMVIGEIGRSISGLHNLQVLPSPIAIDEAAE